MQRVWTVLFTLEPISLHTSEFVLKIGSVRILDAEDFTKHSYLGKAFLQQ